MKFDPELHAMMNRHVAEYVRYIANFGGVEAERLAPLEDKNLEIYHLALAEAACSANPSAASESNMSWEDWTNYDEELGDEEIERLFDTCIYYHRFVKERARA